MRSAILETISMANGQEVREDRCDLAEMRRR